MTLTMTRRKGIKQEGIFVRVYPEQHAMIGVLAALYQCEQAEVLELALSRVWKDELAERPSLAEALEDAIHAQKVKAAARERLKRLGSEGRDE